MLPHEYSLFTVSCYLSQHNGRTVENSLRTIHFSADKGRFRLDNNPNFVAERSLKTSSHHTFTTRTTIVSLDSLKIRWTHITLVTENIPVTYKVAMIKLTLVFQINFAYTNLQYMNSLQQGGSRSDI